MKTPERWMDFWMTFAHWSWRWLPLLPFLLGGLILLIASLGAQMFPVQQPKVAPIEGMTLRIVGGREAWVQGNPAYVELGTVYDSRMNPMSGCVILEVR